MDTVRGVEPAGGPAMAGKVRALEAELRALAPVVIAFSGGVDSTLLYAEARRVLEEGAVAVIGVSPSLARADLEHARDVARTLGPLVELTTDEQANPDYAANRGDRCFHCKNELFGRIARDARFRGRVVCDGTHADDRVTDRPGTAAGALHRVRSPLRTAQLGKADIRWLARERGLSNWERPASPCLASRIAVGTSVSAKRLGDVEAIEALLREHGFRVFRARVDDRDLIVTPGPEELGRLGESSWRERVLAEGRRRGFARVLVDLAGYRSPDERLRGAGNGDTDS